MGLKNFFPRIFIQDYKIVIIMAQTGRIVQPYILQQTSHAMSLRMYLWLNLKVGVWSATSSVNEDTMHRK